MKNRYLGIVAGLLLLAGCSNDGFIDNNGKEQQKLTSFTTVKATVGEDADTRAYLTGDISSGYKSVSWSDDDEILVFSDTQQDFTEYSLVKAEDNSGLFGGSEVSGNKFYALYPPYRWSIDENNPNILHYWFNINGPATDDNGYAFYPPMLAVSNDNSFEFKQLTGSLHVAIGNLYEIYSAVLYGNNGEQLGSSCYVDLSDEEPVIVMDGEDSPDYTGYWGYWYDQAVLNGGTRDIYFFIPPTTFEKGFRLKITGYDETGKEIRVTKSISSKVVVERAQVHDFKLVDMNAELIAQEEAAKVLDAKQRKILKEFYDALDGDNWTNNTNWNSDKPLSEWYGLRINEEGQIYDITLIENNLNGSIPESIGELNALKYLYLWYNSSIEGNIPQSLAKLTHLEDLELRGTSVSGSIPDIFGNLPRLRSLSLGANYLTGSLPESMGSLSNLRNLEISGYWGRDSSLKIGPFPTWIRNLKNLGNLSLTTCGITGELPTWLPELTNLSGVQLQGNELSGNIPKEYIKFEKLAMFHIFGNNLEGVIPEEIQESNWWNNVLVASSFEYQKNGKKLLLGDEDERKALNELYEATGGDNWTNNEGWTSHRMLKYWYGITTDNDNHVTRIDLDENNLTGMLPDVFSNFTKLTGAYFADNNLEHSSVWVKDGNGKLLYYTTQPAFLAGLVKLMSFGTLDISGNKINGCIWQQFSDAIYNTNENVWGKGNGQRRRITLKLSQQNGYGMYYQTDGDGGTIPVKYTLATFEYVVPNLQSSFQ